MCDFQLKFSPNISTMFPKESYVIDNIFECRDLGFATFEGHNFYDTDVADLIDAKDTAGIHLDLTNSPPESPIRGGEDVIIIEERDLPFGYACIPGREDDFLQTLNQAIRLCKETGCQKLHILAGLKEGNNIKLMKKTYIKNLRIAGNLLKEENIIGLIEPLCPRVKANYFLDDFNDAVQYLKEVDNPNIRLMLDIYHLEMLHGDACSLIEKFYPYTGHVQVSQAPKRDEPNARGLIDYAKVFQILYEKGHDDYIGLEYFTEKKPRESLLFLQRTGIFGLNPYYF